MNRWSFGGIGWPWVRADMPADGTTEVGCTAVNRRYDIGFEIDRDGRRGSQCAEPRAG